MSSTQMRPILHQLNESIVAIHDDRLIHELFEEQVRRTPSALALVQEGRSVTYAGLNRQGNQIARFLRERGIGPGRLVGICFERGPEMVAALLGILKAGGAYVPLDPRYPRRRITYMLEDAKPDVVLTQEHLRPLLSASGTEILALDKAWKRVVDGEDTNIDPGPLGLTCSDLAYVIYTSGSTGQPKGVAAEHRSMVNRITAQAAIAPFAAEDVCCHKTSIGFIDAVFEILGPLCYGRPLVLAAMSTTSDLMELAKLINKEHVTRLITVPSLAQAFVGNEVAVRCMQGIRGWTLSGEELLGELLLGLQTAFPRCRFVNLYGSSEVAGDATYYAIDSNFESGKVPIGRPIPNTRVYILNDHLQPVEHGATGEIYVSGPGLARGYLNRPDLTAERFLADPFSSDSRVRMFKTGDRARWRPEGTVEYLGRNDQQVKIRGFRIELGEVEAQLRTHSGVQDAVVVAREDRRGDRQLVAYVTPSNSAQALTTEVLREHISGLLPEHMVPAAFVIMAQFPLTPSGKVDRLALATSDPTYSGRPYEPPRGAREETLAAIWQDLLHIDRAGRLDNFFELGGHSLLIVGMMDQLRRAGLAVEAKQVYETPGLADLAAALTLDPGGDVDIPPSRIPSGCEHIRPDMLPLVAFDQADIERVVAAVPGGAANVQDIYPLAPLQRGLLFHHLLDSDGGDTYVLSTLLSLPSRERLEELVAALQWAVDRHDILRTAVLWEGLPQPVQVVYRQATLSVETITLHRAGDPLEQLKEQMDPARQRLNLRRGPLIRLKIASDPHGSRWYALLQNHHLVCDETSMDVLLEEVMAHLEGRADALPQAPAYRNHVVQAKLLADKHDADAFFRRKLGDVEEPTAPFGILDVQGEVSAIEEFNAPFDSEQGRRARLAARKLAVSPATLFHAAWALVVSRTSAKDDVVYGTVLLGRMQGSSGAERGVGVFVNTLPLRINLRGMTAKGLVDKTHRELMELLVHEQTPLAEAQRSSGITGTAPLFTTLFNYRHRGKHISAALTGAAGIELIAVVERTNYPITLSVDDLNDDFMFTVQTHPGIDPRRVLGYFEVSMRSLLDALEHTPEATALALAVLPDRELTQVVELFNATRAEYRGIGLIHELFERQVRRAPDVVAVEHEGRRLTYRQLNRRANQLARYLVSQGVGPDGVVGICMERSLEMVVGVIGVLKAGGAYLPLDPNYPTERLRHMLEDAAPKIVLTETELVGALPGSKAQVVALDQKLGQIAAFVDQDLNPNDLGLSPDDLVYVIYTSGSTGRPKGTAMRHRSVANLIEWHRRTFGQREGRRVLQFAALSFDVAFQETFSTLCTGGTLVLLDEWVRRDAKALTEFLATRSIERLFVPPLMLQSLAEHAKGSMPVAGSLRDVIAAGEQLRISPEIRLFFAGMPECQLHNHYGPTETHVVTAYTLKENPALWPALPPIGRPIANARIYVLDGQMQPVPVGVVGEIYIGGVNTARGYLNRPELTTQRFVPDPYSSERDARLYKTGDLGRWRDDGLLECLGRNDDQVKIRGFRIELKEIEAQLVLQESVKDAAVLAREDIPGEKRLVAYITPRGKGSPNIHDLRKQLTGLMPEYMVPRAFVILKDLPVTPTGKLDRRSLPPPDLAAYVTREYDAPRGEVEETLARAWQDVLHVAKIGRNDNFFELGGHSLIIVQMLERLRQAGLSVEARRVFETPTLADLATALMRGGFDEPSVPPNRIPPQCDRITPDMVPLVQLEPQHIEKISKAVPGGAANVQDIYPLAPLQEGILFHHVLESDADTYVVSMLLSFRSAEKLQSFMDALQCVIERHDILRTAVLWEDLPRPVQVVYRHAALSVEEIALDPARNPTDELKERIHSQQRLDIRLAPMIRLQVALGAEDKEQFALLQVHHLTCDHESLDTMMAELAEYMTGRSETLPKPAGYRVHVAQALMRAKIADAEAFFRQKLSDIDEPTFPFGLEDVRGNPGRLTHAIETVAPQLSERIRSHARRLGMSAATLFHAAWALVVSRASGREDVVFGTVLLGRLQGSAGAQRILGMFMNTLPIRIRLKGITAKELIDQVQKEILQLLPHEQVSLAVAQRCSGVSSSSPLFSALLNYRHSAPDLPDRLDSAGVRLLYDESWTNYPFVLSVEDLDDKFVLDAQTNQIVDPNILIGHVSTALESLVNALDATVPTEALDLNVLCEGERRQIIDAFNATQSDSFKGKLIHELFEDQVAKTPDSVAVRIAGGSVTFVELNRSANQLARRLRNSGVGPDDIVAICLERNLDMVIGMLGVLKAGGGFLLLDAAYPPPRLAHMLAEALPKVLLTQAGLRCTLPPTGAEIIVMDAIKEESGALDASNKTCAIPGLSSRSIAYIIYTSGSTGEPKGVIAEHENMVNRIAAQASIAPFSPGDVCCQKTAVGFVDAIFEILGPLCYGCTLAIAPATAGADPIELAWFIREERITRLVSVPSLARALLDSNQSISCLQSLRCWTLSGEELTADLAAKLTHLLPDCALLNLYGSSEVAADAVCYRVNGFEGGRVPIGKPIQNTRVYILDSQLRPLPVGGVGEIYIAGAGVARGYLRRPDLTAQSFICEAFSAGGDRSMYRTGDLGRWRRDGVIEYLGRRDNQVKIRGARIELGEIEAHLRRQAEVRDAVVMAREDVPGEKRLVAYFIPKDGLAIPGATSLRERLLAILPQHMVPAGFVALGEFPRTSSGKVDRRGMPVPEPFSHADGKYDAPRGEVEEIVAGIWQQLLHVERVGRNDNFFELGGHSLHIVQMAERLRSAGLPILGRRVFERPTLMGLAASLIGDCGSTTEVPPNGIFPGCESITPAMLPLVNIGPEHIDRIASSVPGGPANIQDIYPLTQLQEGILFHHLMNAETADVYARPILLHLESRSRLDSLIAALEATIVRHDALRTAVLWEHLPHPVQVVYRQARLVVLEVPLESDRSSVAQFRERMTPARLRLDLREAPLMRLEVAPDPEGAGWYALICTHHLICDNESIDMLLSEVWELLDGRADALPQPAPYRRHVAEALAYARSCDAASFFRRKLGDVDEPTVPFGVTDVRSDGARMADAHERLGGEGARRLRIQARRLGVSTATVLHAAWALVIARTTGRDDVVFGTVLLGRLHGLAGAQRILGMFINTLPLRLRLRDLTSEALVRQTQRELVELLSYEQAPLAEAQRCSAVAKPSPLFTALLNYRHGTGGVVLGACPASGVALIDSRGGTNYPVVLSVTDCGDEFHLEVETDRAIDPYRLMGYVQTAIESLVQALEKSSSGPALALTVLPQPERQQVIEGFNPRQIFPQDQLIQELFEANVRLRPTAVAVSCEGQAITYAELNTQANQLAWYLRRKGVGAGHLVGICVERGLEMVVGLLGILKSGAAYLPLDPVYPRERLAYMLGDAVPTAVLVQEATRNLMSGCSAEILVLDNSGDLIAKESKSNPSLRPQGSTSTHLAYVMYTSGSTGKPKGVMVEHRNVVRLFAATKVWFGFNEHDVWTMFHSFAFDFSVWELWGALLHGGRVVMVPYLKARDPSEFYRLVCEQGVTVLNQTPSAFGQLIDAQQEHADCVHSLRYVIFGGEALEFRILRPWVRRNGTEATQLVNMYGITETTVHTTYRRLSRDEIESERGSVVGKPLRDVSVYLLDRDRQPVPIGVSGEIYVGGAGVTRGYLNRELLTAERFVHDPYDGAPSARMYKSGDLGRWRADGSIEYLGRNDEQVKIRGFRIELGEIEGQLAAHDQVKQAAVVAREDLSGEKRLVAYVVPKDAGTPPGPEALKEHLRKMLPEYMIPSAFVSLAMLPLTSNGKLDRKALPVPTLSSPLNQAFEAPEDHVEVILAEIYQELLQAERPSRHANFFELGGHSLTGVKLINQIKERLGTTLSVAAIFQYPTIKEMAEAVRWRQEHDAMTECDDEAELEEGIIDFSSRAVRTAGRPTPGSVPLQRH